MSRWFRDKFGIVDSYLPWLLIALAVLAVVMITISLLRSEGSSLIDKLKDMFKFGFLLFGFKFKFLKG
ncbi:MAG: hypothetical protein ABEI74_03140 [Candidatus Pacearchaeota archaeon]